MSSISNSMEFNLILILFCLFLLQKLLAIPMAEFHLVLDSVWTKPDNFKVVLSETAEEESEGGDSGVSDDEEGPEEMETDDDDEDGVGVSD